MVQSDFSQPLFGVVFLKGSFYKLFTLVLDVAGIVVLLILGGFLVRRLIVKPEGIETVREDHLVNALLFAIMITGFIVEGVRIAATELQTSPDLARFSPVGMLMGQLFVGMSAVLK
jgi:nitrate reductase gamma subunit